jgi:DNA-binding PadR family transcriptional regulator
MVMYALTEAGRALLAAVLQPLTSETRDTVGV